MVHMHKGSFNVGQDLDFILKLLAKVMCLPEGSIPVHNYVNFHEIILERIVMV